MKMRGVIVGVALLAGIAAAQSEGYKKSLSCGMAGLRAKDANAASSCLSQALPAADSSYGKMLALVLLAKAELLRPDAAAAEQHYLAAVAAAEAPVEKIPAELLYAGFLELQGRPDEAKAMRAKAEEWRNEEARKSSAAAAAAQQDGEPQPPVYKAGNGITQPVPLYHPEPQYSEEARLAGLVGSVVLYFEVSPDGGATNIKVIKTLGLGLDQKAIEALQQWKLKPGTRGLGGSPVTVMAQVEVNFRLL